jgi:fibronectin type 3 domain-containing protein
MVQTIVKLDNRKEAESDLSDEASIVPRDIFPPAAPKGLQGSTAPNSIELNWERNTEEDLNGYRVYRGEGNGALEKIADVTAVPSYSDRKVEHGKSYRYAITAVDQAGNESPRSAPVEVTMP